MSLVDAIPASIKEIGRIEAAGKAAGGRYGQSIADIGQMVGQIPEQMRVNRSRAMQEQLQTLHLAQAKREEAADLAIQNATTAALLPDGTVDPAKLAQHLAGTPAASKLPAIMDSFNKITENKLRLQQQIINTQEAEDDAIGSIVHAADQAEHPEDKAALMATGFASGRQTGTIRKERANQLLAEILKDDGTPDPEKVGPAIKRHLAGSKEQRTLAMTEAQKESAAESAKALKEQREATTAQHALQNYANQLTSTTTRDRYARIYQGIPAEMRGYFDAPEEWTPDSSRHAGTVMLTPTEREAIRRDTATADRDKATAAYREEQLDIARQNADANSTRAETAAATAAATAAKPKDTADDPEYRRYKDFAAQYENAQQEARMRAAPRLGADGYPIGDAGKDIAPYQPPPSFEKWQAMSPGERAAVLRDPNARINDAELSRRRGGAQAAPVAAPAPAAAAPAAPPAATAAPAAGGKMVTLAELERVAKLKGTTVDAQRTRYINAGYAVVK